MDAAGARQRRSLILGFSFRRQIVAAPTGAPPVQLTMSPVLSRVLVPLSPDSYTVQVSGVGNTTGVAIVEAYEVP
jgi:hypothetical protein